MIELVLAGLMMGTVGPAADSGFTWDKYDGPEGSRRYKLHVPAVSPAPKRLLVMLHGCTQDPDDLARGTRMNEVAGAKGFIVMYPEQPATANPLKCWNWFAAAHQKRGEGEPALLAAMIRKVAEERNVDPRCIYIAGISAGGAMTAILAATYPELVRAMAIHSGIAYGLATQMSEALVAMRTPRGDSAALAAAVVKSMGERRSAIPTLIVQGASDASVNVANAELLAGQWRGVNGKAAEVETWIVDGLGHAWSGGSRDGTFTDDKTPDASKAIVDFFLRVGPAKK